MKYEKQWASIDEQIAFLTKVKGLEVDNIDGLRLALRNIGYYRLSAYWFPYKTIDAKGQAVFCENTSFTKIMRAYEFDRDLRLVMFGAIAEIEVYFRGRLSYLASGEDGVFGFPESVKLRLSREYSAAKKGEQFIKHFVAKYGDEHDLPPFWMMVECATMGTIELLYQGVSSNVRAEVASELGIKVPVLKNWLSVLRVARNAYCHHSRVWNRTWGVRPMIPKDWKGFGASNGKTFAVLSVLYYLLDAIGDAAPWRKKLDGLLGEYGDIDLDKLGFPEYWRTMPPWCGAAGDKSQASKSDRR